MLRGYLFGVSCGPLGRFWGLLDASWGLFGASWSSLAASWKPRGELLGPSWPLALWDRSAPSAGQNPEFPAGLFFPLGVFDGGGREGAAKSAEGRGTTFVEMGCGKANLSLMLERALAAGDRAALRLLRPGHTVRPRPLRRLPLRRELRP